MITQLVREYSSWFKLKRMCAWLMRYKSYCVCKYLKRDEQFSQEAHLSFGEMRTAETLIFRHVQHECYSKELGYLKAGRYVPKASKLFLLNPVIKDDLIRVGGRISRATVALSSRHQVILPQHHEVTTLIVRDTHEQNGHVGPRHMLSYLREKIWVIAGIQVCKSIVSNCFDCKRQRTRPTTQMMSDLPLERLTPDLPPFSYVGIDFFGPFSAKYGRGVCKRYGCIFTCMATRAVHIEIAHSVNTDSFLGAFSRFISRRGRPKKVYSDNGTNLKSGERELREMMHSWNQQKISKELLQSEIEWHFNPPYASHNGGFWERLIRSIREVLRAIVKQQLLCDESLLTFISETERILNSRPITQASTNSDDPEPLTPSKLLLLRNESSFPNGVFRKSDSYINRWWRQAHYLANVFWKRQLNREVVHE